MTRSKAPGKFYPVGAGPTHCVGGVGAHLFTTDGAALDTLAALGAISLGMDVTTGVFSLPTEWEVLACEAVLEHLAQWATSAKFFKTGTAATSGAHRIARKATGRRYVLMGDWAYHGDAEWSDDPTYPFTERFPLGADLRVMFKGLEPNIAAVFIEPHRWAHTDKMWLQSVRDYCTDIGAVFVLDEMIWGGRVAFGGATEWFGIQPDLAAYGKALGGGQAAAFLVGRDVLAEHGHVVSGTFSGDVVGLRAVIETIKTYVSEPVIATLWQRGRQLQNGLREIIPPDVGVCEGLPVHQRVRFFNESHGPQFSKAMLARGIIWHPACANVMFAHTAAQIDQVLGAARESVACL